MNLLKFLVILQLHHAWTLNMSLKGWQLRSYKPMRSIDRAIQDYFSTKTRLLSVALHLQYQKYWRIFINDYLTDVLKRTESMSFKIHVNNEHWKWNRHVFQHNLWYVDSYEAFKFLLPDFKNYPGAEIGQYMVIMQTGRKRLPYPEVRKIFQHAFQLNMVNIAVAVYIGNASFSLYSYNVFEPGQCRQTQPRQVNMFQNGKFNSPELFPYKFGNFHKCPLRLFVRYADPYFTFNLTKDNRHIHRYWGMEAMLVDTMVQRLNFTLKFYYKKMNFYGTVFQNGTPTGPFELLKKGHIDIILGYYNYLAPSRYFSFSEAYFITPLVLVYYEHKKSLFENRWVWQPFRQHVWLVIIIIIVFGIIFAAYLQYNFRKEKGFPIPVTWLDIVGLALGNARPFRFHRMTTKYAFTFGTFGFMILCAIYQGKLYEAFNRRVSPNVASVQNLVDSNYTFLLREVIDKDIISSLNVPPRMVQYMSKADDFSIYKEMQRYPTNVATITNYWQFQAYIHRNRLYSEFNMIPEIVVMNQIGAYTRHHSYLNKPISHLLGNLNSAGVIEKWKTNTAIPLDFGNNKENLQKINEIILSTEPIPLSMAKVYWLFEGLIVMYWISIFVILGEIVAKKIS